MAHPQMEVNNFFNWCRLRHDSCGAPLKDLPLERWTDWEFVLGFFSFHCEPGASDDTVIKQVYRRTTQQFAALPEGFQPLKGEVGSVWLLQNNYCEDACELFHVQSKKRHPVKVLFQPKVEAEAGLNSMIMSEWS